MKWLTDLFSKDRKTSTAGALAGVPFIIEGIQKQDWTMVLAGVGMILTGLFASDKSAEKKQENAEG